MHSKKITMLVLTAIIVCGGCTNTRYLTDATSIRRQHEMRSDRVGKNIGEVCLNLASFIFSAVFNTEFISVDSERTFKRISIYNESTDSLYINMVTDIVWKEDGYCDIMGIVLPAGTKQKLLAPYPSAYNVYFRTSASEEEKLEIRTDRNHRRFKLRAGMTDWLDEK